MKGLVISSESSSDFAVRRKRGCSFLFLFCCLVHGKNVVLYGILLPFCYVSVSSRITRHT